MEIKKATKEKRKKRMYEETHQENMNAIEFPDEHACYYDEEDEQWFKEKDEQWAKNIPCFKEDVAKVVLNSLDFDFDMQNKDLDDFLKNLAAQDSSSQPTKVLAPATDDLLAPAFEVPTPQRVPAPVVNVITLMPERVPAPVVTVTTPMPRWVHVPSPQRVIGSTAPAPQRVYTFADLVSVSSTTACVPTPQRLLASQVPAKSPEETLNSIAFEQVHVPIRYQHHLLPQNMEYNHVMLSGDSSRSIRRKKYIHWTKEEHMSFLLGLEKNEDGGWKNFSKKFVPSKTPSQIASHAQKYFKRKNAPKKERKRRSIHDTTLEDSDMIVTPCVGQHNWVPPPPNFAMQPHEIQQTQRMQQQFNLHNSFHQMGGYRNFNRGHQQNELHLAVQQFLPNMPHQMGRYGFSSNWPHDIEHKN